MSLYQVIREIMVRNVLWIICFLISFWFIFIRLPRKPKHFPPGPTGLPILGVALSIGKRLEKTFLSWAKKYGSIMGFKIGSNYTVVLNSYEIMQEAFVKYSSAFSHRPNHYIFRDALLKSGLLASDHSVDYMTQRKFTHGVLGKLGFGKTVMEVPIVEEARNLLNDFGPGNIELNMENKTKIKYATANIIAQLAFGKRFSEHGDPEFRIILDAWNAFFHTATPAFNAALISPWLLYLPGLWQRASGVQKNMDKQLVVIEKYIKEHRETLDESNPRDFIDEYLIDQKKNKADKSYSDQMLKCIVRDLFGGGIETTELTLIFTCLVLANRPHIRKKIFDEIDTVLGPEGTPRYALREKMPYCHATIKEMMRFRTAGPLLVPHAVLDNIKFKEYEIPKESTVIGNVHAVHFDPNIWENPDEFNPERFIGEDGKVETSKFFMPFGLGPRVCIGRRLADMQIFLFFLTLFQRYDVIPTPQPGCEVPHVCDEADSTGVGLNPSKHTPVTLVPRKRAKQIKD